MEQPEGAYASRETSCLKIRGLLWPILLTGVRYRLSPVPEKRKSAQGVHGRTVSVRRVAGIRKGQYLAWSLSGIVQKIVQKVL